MSDQPWISEHDTQMSRELAEGMLAEGVNPFPKVPVDYFATGEDAKTMLPDDIQFVTHKVLNEGDRKRYMKAVNRDLKIQKGTGDAIMRLAAGEDRTALLKVAITGWSLFRNGQPWPFTPANLNEFVENGPIRILELVEREVKKNNPWLFADMTAEDVKEEIARLEELLVEIQDREEGKSGSAN